MFYAHSRHHSTVAHTHRLHLSWYAFATVSTHFCTVNKVRRVFDAHQRRRVVALQALRLRHVHQVRVSEGRGHGGGEPHAGRQGSAHRRSHQFDGLSEASAGSGGGRLPPVVLGLCAAVCVHRDESGVARLPRPHHRPGFVADSLAAFLLRTTVWVFVLACLSGYLMLLD